VSEPNPEGRAAVLAAERTDLAWYRSGLSLVGCGALIVRGLNGVTTRDVVLGVFVLILGAAVSFLGAWHARHVHSRGTRATTLADLAPIAFGVACVGLAAFVVAAARG
jgi:uncharacterized membrane protein YidH (DUF202 family)